MFHPAVTAAVVLTEVTPPEQESKGDTSDNDQMDFRLRKSGCKLDFGNFV